MAGGVPIPSWIRILRKRPSIGEDLAVLHIALGEDDHAARDLENSFVIIVRPDSWSSARHAMNVRIESLLDPAFLDQFSSPRLVRQRILQRRGDIDKLAGNLRVCTGGPARFSDVDPSPHTGEVGFPVGGARSRSGEVRLSIRGLGHSGSRIAQPLCQERRRTGGQKYWERVAQTRSHKCSFSS